MTTRYCKRCDSFKNIDLFGKDLSQSDGMGRYCLQCTNKWTDENRKLRRDKKELHKKGLQKCKKCGIVKQLDKFWSRDRILPNGSPYREYNSTCKDCMHTTPKYKLELKKKRQDLFAQGKMICSVCSEIKDISQFGKAGHGKVNCRCKKCKNKSDYITRLKPERQAKAKNYKPSQESIKRYYEKKKKWRVANKEKLRLNEFNRLHNDPIFKTIKYLRVRLNGVSKGHIPRKNSRTMELLDCSVDWFMLYIESQFEKGMMWDNHTTQGWHIDHYFPIKAFNLKDPLHLRACFNWINLRPMWGIPNISKGAKYDKQEFDKYIYDFSLYHAEGREKKRAKDDSIKNNSK